MRFYGQQGEDSLLWDLFGGHVGTFVDVGASDGWRFSNTLVFEQNGWSGVCIEPHPLYYQLLRLRRTKSLCLEFLAGTKDLEGVEFWITDIGELSSIIGNKDQDAHGKANYAGWRKIKVPMRRLDTIMSVYGIRDVDFLSVDAESADLQVLMGFDFWRFRPRVVLVESNESDDVLTAFMTTAGYVMGKRHYFNLFYFRDQEDIVFLRDHEPHDYRPVPHVLSEEWLDA